MNKSWAEQQKVRKEQTNNLDRFVVKQPFGVKNLNLMLVIWVLRHALPWARFEDCTLRAAFWFANPLANIYSAAWAAQGAQRLYIGLQSNVLSSILVRFVSLI